MRYWLTLCLQCLVLGLAWSVINGALGWPGWTGAVGGGILASVLSVRGWAREPRGKGA